jgi:hypothetical protein
MKVAGSTSHGDIDRVEHRAELRFLFPASREVAVDPVRQRGTDEQQQREPVRPGPVEIEKHHGHARRGEQPDYRQYIGNRDCHAACLTTRKDKVKVTIYPFSWKWS